MPYLTVDDYLDRYGEPETIRITDTTKSGAVDEDMVALRIGDAEQYANGYLAVRYTLPIAEAPEPLKGAIASLARELLHRTRPVDAVTMQADRARTWLKDIASGRAQLLIDGASSDDTPEDAEGANAVRTRDGLRRVFTDESMSGYGVPNASGWRNGPFG